MRPRIHLHLAALCLTTSMAAQAAAMDGTTRGMARIPAGRYRPLYAPAGAPPVYVRGFALDRTPVTRGAFEGFVRAHPAWARGAVQAQLAEPAYLADWPSASSAGKSAERDRPVTSISWFAAKAYCAAQGKRLPTVDEWELAAAASETRRDASGDPAARRRLLAQYAARVAGRLPAVGHTRANVYGVRDLHGVVWEWTLDFNPMAGPDGSRAAGRGHHAHDHHLFCASAAIGATDPSNFPAFERHAVRAGLTPRSTLGSMGFRCAADLPQ